MKKLLITYLIFVFSFQIYSQNSASANVASRATVIDPIRIQKTVDLDFGNVIASQTAGKLVLSPEGTRVAYGVSVSNALPGHVSPAEALVSHGELTYDISLPDFFTLFNEDNPDQRVILNDFTVGAHLSNEGTDIIKIGASLNMEANQAPGFYSNPNGFNVTVTYN